MKPASRIILDDPYAKWFSAGWDPHGPLVHGRGYAFIDGVFFEGQALVDAVRKQCSRGLDSDGIAALKDLIPKINGAWALVAEWLPGHVVAATDRMRSIPLFYAERERALLLSCSVYPILDELSGVQIGEPAAIEYLLAGYVTGGDTLYEGVKQVRPGEIIEYDPAASPPRLATHRYYRFLAEEYCSSVSEEEMESRLAAILDRVFSRHLKAWSGRQLVVPLSGGLDSRMLVAMLKRHGADNVLCFSYGVPGNEEAQLSRQSAEALGYDWEFVEYNKDVWTRWMAKEEMQSCLRYACQGVSLPLFQDLPAVAQLVERGRINNAIALAGHTSLDAFHTPWNLILSGSSGGVEVVVDYILDHYLDLWRRDRNFDRRRELLRGRVSDQIAAADPHDNCTPWARYNMWEVENRMTKFILNSHRMYEFCGIDWALPLWDYELMDFVLPVPMELRWGKKLVANTLVDKLLSGPLRPLADVPRTSYYGLPETGRVTGDGSSTITKQQAPSRVRAYAGRALDCLGLLGVARRLKFRRVPDSGRAFDYWFAEGRDPRRVTVGETFERLGMKKHLPPALWAILEPHRSLLLIQAFCNGLLSAVVLAEEYKRSHSERNGNDS